MEIIKITKERMEQVLPPNIKDSDLSVYAQKVLATIINYHLVNEKARATGFLAISDSNLRESACIGKEYLKTAIQELVESKLITRKAGKKWKAGEKSEASEYRLNLENIRKFTKKPTADELLETLFSTPLEAPSTKESPTILYCTDTYTDSDSDTESESESYSTILDCTNTSTTLDLKIGSLAPLGGGAAPVKIERMEKTEEELEDEFRQHKERILQELDSQLQGITQYQDINNINNQVLSSMSNLCCEPYYTRLKKVVGCRLEQFKKELLASMTSST